MNSTAGSSDVISYPAAGSRDVISSPAAAGSRDNISRPGASSSNMGGRGKNDSRDLERDEAPDKVQKILSICIGQGASDKKGEVNAETYDEDLKAMAEDYRCRNASGECFVHIRKQYSSNKDLRALKGIGERRRLLQSELGIG